MESLSITASPNFQLKFTTTPHLPYDSRSPAITMADADEDVSHLGASEGADVDLTEETQDFRFLDKLMCDFHSHASSGVKADMLMIMK